MSLSKIQEIVKDRGVWSAVVHSVTKSWIQLSKQTATIILKTGILLFLYFFPDIQEEDNRITIGSSKLQKSIKEKV